MKLIKTNLPILLAMLFTLLDSSYAQTQVETNRKAEERYKKAEDDLNNLYQKTVKEFVSRPKILHNLTTGQELWLKIRNAQVAAKFPASDDYRTVWPARKFAFLESSTRDRIKSLNLSLIRAREEACRGPEKWSPLQLRPF